MTRKRFHGLKKVKVRASWNKYNLYNLTRLRSPFWGGTFYQQKWLAKSTTRAYHGEQIREGQWEKMFRSRLNAVVPMDHRYLAEHDGSEHAAGRGSGKDRPLDMSEKLREKQQIPWLHMTYAPIERRLDMAVWRALFASSARQARQFCTHGMVKVNGQVMPYAGYLLNPGDMFQVDPDSVMFATGARKESRQIKVGRKVRQKRARLNKRLRLPNPKPALPERRFRQKTPVEEEVEEKEKEVDTWAVPKLAINMQEYRKQRLATMDQFIGTAQLEFERGKSKLGAKRKQDLRALIKDARGIRALINRKSEAEIDDSLAKLIGQFKLIRQTTKADAAAATPKAVSRYQHKKQKILSKRLRELYLKELTTVEEEVEDTSKPYATPWKPRPFMSPFAFIPRYLEVQHSICSAVYLRHPVARPGLAEVPTPFGSDINQLAFTWYLRRR
ncbi:hypothetical protein BJ878DRAFT_575918 [Calycina marina]|uniref:RNA-binding S4 domain-containing protein n=1 Tax=Calycina marina TaxID=1763456 RepID=A0A9P8CEL1_9HELO|nr:hypothetical protein BJ878DRAFT_575918 [Calycina marina]